MLWFSKDWHVLYTESTRKYLKISWNVPWLRDAPFIELQMYRWSRQGTLYTREGYSTVCAVVNQQLAWLFENCQKHFFIAPKAYSTAGWQLHIRYHSLPIYKEFPGCYLMPAKNTFYWHPNKEHCRPMFYCMVKYILRNLFWIHPPPLSVKDNY